MRKFRTALLKFVLCFLAGLTAFFGGKILLDVTKALDLAVIFFFYSILVLIFYLVSEFAILILGEDEDDKGGFL